jgi:hypothetical protein
LKKSFVIVGLGVRGKDFFEIWREEGHFFLDSGLVEDFPAMFLT